MAKGKIKIKPVHPGRILRQEFMEPRAISNYALAKASGLSEVHIGNIMRGKRNISAEVALRLEAVFGMSAQAWLNLQTLFDLETAQAASGKKIARTTKKLAFRHKAIEAEVDVRP